MLAPGSAGMVVTPLAPARRRLPAAGHAAGQPRRLQLDPGHGGARVEVDGQVRDGSSRRAGRFTLRLEAGFATLVSLGEHEP